MLFSAFTPFGQFAFSSRTPKAQQIFEAMRENLGGDENVTDAFDDSHISATLYARSIVIASAAWAIEHAKCEKRPSNAEEALEAHEKDFGIHVPVGASSSSRREALSVAEKLQAGDSRSNVTDALTALQIPGGFTLRYLRDGEYSVNPSNWRGAGNWSRSSRPHKWKRMTQFVEVGQSTTALETVAGPDEPFFTDEVLVVAPGKVGLQERLDVVSAQSGLLTATFPRAYEAGTLLTNAPWPIVTSTARWVIVVVTQAVAESRAWRTKIKEALYKRLLATEYLQITFSIAGSLGPFVIGTSTLETGFIGSLTV